MIGWKSKVMNKVIKEIQESQWESDTWQDEDIPLDFGPNNSVEKEMEKRKRKRREEESRERGSTFSLNFPVIGPSVSGGARDKVLPRNESFKLRSKTRSFDKLQEVGVFLLLGLILV